MKVTHLAGKSGAGMLVLMLLGCGQSPTPSGSDPPSESPRNSAALQSIEPSPSMLPNLFMPSFGALGNTEPQDYGWTGNRGSSAGMHNVVKGGDRQTQMYFYVADDCFGEEGPEPVPIAVAGFDGWYVEPHPADFPNTLSLHTWAEGDETTGAYALAIGDRTLCVYLSWDPTTTRAELDAARAVIESIRAQPISENGIRIVFTALGWDNA
jgi:hypothetical protein